MLGSAVREGATTALRHAAPARVSLRAERVGDRVELELRNDGVRPSPARPGTGLRSLAERVTEANGSVDAAVEPDGTSRLRIERVRHVHGVERDRPGCGEQEGVLRGFPSSNRSSPSGRIGSQTAA